MKTSKIIFLVFLASLLTLSCSKESIIDISQTEDNLPEEFFKYTIGEGPFVYFEDMTFKELLLNNFDINKNRDNEISFEEAKAYEGAIDVSFKNIQSLTGIEEFVNLIALNCTNNKLNSLDVSQNLNLQFLDCGNNPFSKIDLRKNINLTHLDITNTNISTLDLSKNTNLMVLKAVCNYKLETVNVRNKNNSKIIILFLDLKNPVLACVQVDNIQYATSTSNWFIPETARYALNCFDNML